MQSPLGFYQVGGGAEVGKRYPLNSAASIPVVTEELMCGCDGFRQL